MKKGLGLLLLAIGFPLCAMEGSGSDRRLEDTKRRRQGEGTSKRDEVKKMREQNNLFNPKARKFFGLPVLVSSVLVAGAATAAATKHVRECRALNKPTIFERLWWRVRRLVCNSKESVNKEEQVS